MGAVKILFRTIKTKPKMTGENFVSPFKGDIIYIFFKIYMARIRREPKVLNIQLFDTFS